MGIQIKKLCSHCLIGLDRINILFTVVPTEKSVLPDDCDTTPAVVHYTFGKNGTADVQVSNVTPSTINISPRAVICELQPVCVDLEYRG